MREEGEDLAAQREVIPCGFTATERGREREPEEESSGNPPKAEKLRVGLVGWENSRAVFGTPAFDGRAVFSSRSVLGWQGLRKEGR